MAVLPTVVSGNFAKAVMERGRMFTSTTAPPGLKGLPAEFASSACAKGTSNQLSSIPLALNTCPAARFAYDKTRGFTRA